MTGGRVLGFREKDAKLHERGTVSPTYVVPWNRLVRVVSVAELEDYIKRRIAEIEAGINDEIFGTVEEMKRLNAMKAVALFELKCVLAFVRGGRGK